jgi:hypothetical protein
MPIPSVKSGQSEQEYVSECISAIYDEYGQEQAAAICYSTYRKEVGMSGERLVASKLNQLNKYRGINFAAPLEKGPNDPCYEDYVQIGTKMLDGREVPNCVPLEKVEMELTQAGINLQEDYPWEQCIADQTERYGDEEIANKVCGMIRSKYGR